MKTRLKLEVCIDRQTSAMAAIAGEADRIEVCAALDLGGVTPSEGLLAACVEQARAAGRVAVAAMIRPHAGGFVYDAEDVATMRRDIAVAQRLGADAVVFGALKQHGEVDREVCRRLLDAARPMQATFHRAIDHAAEPERALDVLLELGFDRALTSGQATTAIDGAKMIRRLVDRAGDRLIVMPGGGVRPENVADLLKQTGAVEVHARALGSLGPRATDPLGIAFAVRDADVVVVRRLVEAIRRPGPG